MVNKVSELSEKINYLYGMYEENCWKNVGDKINIIFQDNCIAFYYVRDKENIDNFCITFSKNERKVYKYIALKFFDRMLGDVYIYKDGNNFYNNKHKEYLNVIINDEKLLRIINEIVFNQEEVFTNQSINNIFSKKPFKIYKAKFLNSIDERIMLTRRVLRSFNK